MSATTIAAEIEKAVADLRPLEDGSFEVHYVNKHDVPVTRRVHVSAEQVDGSGLLSGRAA